MTIDVRLREERNRIGLNQPDFAALGGKTKKTLIDYEKGKTNPDAEFLAAIAAAGADVQYILTGIRSGQTVAEAAPVYAPLNPRERALLDNYRHIADEGDKRLVERTAQLAVEAAKDEAQSGINKKRA